MRRFLLSFLAIVPGLVAAAAPSIDQSLSFHTAANPQISPDGERVAYEVQKTNWEDNAFETEIWIASAGVPHRPYVLTGGKKSSAAPQWSPDGRQIAFASDREGKRQVYLISPSGGEARQLTKSETAIASFRWSPDGKTIAFTAPDPDPKPLKDRKERYGEFEIVRSDFTRSHLWLQPLEGAATRLTDDSKFSVGAFSWSPDSKRIAFTAVPDPSPNSSRYADIYTVDLASKKAEPLVTTKGADSNPQWSPDGTRIAFETSAGSELSFQNRRIAAVSSTGGAPVILTKAFDESPQLINWTERGIFFEALQKTAAYVLSAESRVLANHTLRRE